VTQTHTANAAPATGSKSLPARIVGILFSPRATYGDVAARPRVLGVFAVVLAVIVGATFVFLSTDVGQQASLDNQIRQMESFGRPISDAQYQRMEQMAPYSRYFAGGFQLILMPIMALIVAGMAYGVFNAALGEDARFKQVYAVVAHSGVILTVQSLFSLPLAYARGTMSGATNLGVFFPFLDDNTFPARLLGSIDLFLVWWFISLAIGLGVLYRKRTGPIATTLLVIYASIGLVIAAVKTATSGA
jgi:hypothetical protein